MVPDGEVSKIGHHFWKWSDLKFIKCLSCQERRWMIANAASKAGSTLVKVWIASRSIDGVAAWLVNAVWTWARVLGTWTKGFWSRVRVLKAAYSYPRWMLGIPSRFQRILFCWMPALLYPLCWLRRQEVAPWWSHRAGHVRYHSQILCCASRGYLFGWAICLLYGSDFPPSLPVCCMIRQGFSTCK